MKKEDFIMKKHADTDTKQSKTIRGLCITCNNISDCSFRAIDANRLIWYCELFDCFVEVEKVVETAKAILGSQPLEKGYGKYEGLCANCKNCLTCIFTKPEGGIWHCEEYE